MPENERCYQYPKPVLLVCRLIRRHSAHGVKDVFKGHGLADAKVTAHEDGRTAHRTVIGLDADEADNAVRGNRSPLRDLSFLRTPQVLVAPGNFKTAMHHGHVDPSINRVVPGAEPAGGVDAPGGRNVSFEALIF